MTGAIAKKSPRRPPIVIKNEPYIAKVLPGNANYADIAKQGKKTGLIGDSIIKRINMREFNDYLEKGVAIKRSFPGATAIQINYYFEELLNEEKSDRIIINVGSNNICNQEQSEKELFEEIMEIVRNCHSYVINNIFVSCLTPSPDHQPQINVLNNLIRENATSFKSILIDNSDIEERHLWKDKLHLNNHGIINLARNFLYSLETGLSDHHKIVITVLKTTFKKHLQNLFYIETTKISRRIILGERA